MALLSPLLNSNSRHSLTMKLSNILLLTQLSGAYAYELRNAAVINILKTAISNGVVEARSSGIGKDQASAEIASFVPLLMDDILLPIFDEAVDHVLGEAFTAENFPPFISHVEQALADYEKSPAFSSATSLLSLVRTHYDYHKAVQLASASMDGYYNLLKGAILPITGEPGPSKAIVEGLFAVTRLICQLQLTDGSVCDPYASEQIQTSAAETPVESSSEASATSAAEPVSTEAAAESSAAPVSSGAAPVSSGAAPVSSGAAPVSSAPAPVSSGAAPVSSAPAPISSGAAPVSSGSVSVAGNATSVAFTNSTAPYVTSTVTQTATNCINGDCITATITVTTCVPENAKSTVIKTVCPKCEGRTVTITVPCEDEETPAPKPAPAPAPKPDEKPSPKPAPAPAPKPDEKPAPKSEKPAASPAPKSEKPAVSPAPKAASPSAKPAPAPAPKSEKPAASPAPKAAASPAPKAAPAPAVAPKPAQSKPAQASPTPAQANGGNTWAVSTAAGIAAIAALLV
jgi:hypothetical protein